MAKMRDIEQLVKGIANTFDTYAAEAKQEIEDNPYDGHTHTQTVFFDDRGEKSLTVELQGENAPVLARLINKFFDRNLDSGRSGKNDQHRSLWARGQEEGFIRTAENLAGFQNALKRDDVRTKFVEALSCALLMEQKLDCKFYMKYEDDGNGAIIPVPNFIHTDANNPIVAHFEQQGADIRPCGEWQTSNMEKRQNGVEIRFNSGDRPMLPQLIASVSEMAPPSDGSSDHTPPPSGITPAPAA